MSPSIPPIRYWPWLSTLPLAALSLPWGPWPVLLFLGLFGLGLQDLRQSKQAIRRNYPLTGRLRYALE